MSLDTNRNGQGGTRSPFRKNQEIAGKITGPRKWTDSSPTAYANSNSEQLNHHQRQLSAYGGSNGDNGKSSRSVSPNYTATSPTNNGGGGFGNNSLGSPTHHYLNSGGVSPHGGNSPSRTPHPPRCQTSDNASPAHQGRSNGNNNMTSRGVSSGNGDYGGGGHSPSHQLGGNGELQRTRTPEPLPRGYHGNDRAQQALDQQSSHHHHPAFGGNGVNMGGYGGHGEGAASAHDNYQPQYVGSPTHSIGGGGFVRNLQPIEHALSSPEQRALLPIVTIGPTCPMDLVNHVQRNYLEAQKTYLPTIIYTTTTTYTSE